MKISDVLGMALKNLLRRKTRTILTLIGVLIGTTSIAVMMSIGVGMDRTFESQLSRMGSLHTITVNNYYFGDVGNSSQPKSLDDKAVKEFEQIEGVEAVMPQLRAFLKFASGRYVAHVDVIGVNPSKMEAFDFQIAEGRLLNEDDKGAIVFGSQVPYFFYNPRAVGRGGMIVIGDDSQPPPINVLEDRLIMTFDLAYGEDYGGSSGRRKTYRIQGVGILKETGEHNYSAFINIDYLKKLMQDNEREERRLAASQGGSDVGVYYYNSSSGMGRSSSKNQTYETVLVKVTDVNKVEEVQNKIKEMGYSAYSLADARNEMKKTLAVVQAILGAIGAISLLVASLGITNTMYMSIYERTREIGIFKVLGCYLKDIRGMFLLEAALIGFFGGTIGIGFSYGISAIINTVAVGVMPEMGDSSISVIPLWLALAAVGVAVLVGLIAGYFPSKRAMKLSALDAIKNE
ncbi:ABC transporter permease [Acetivibrio straminisolvens]|jgi:ABC-type antimicrobial peptide transport system permease subunit|uniref:ABC transporter permease n=1 Tax=Acetivibrio straminisolvens TaxID=253314 RepID=UPI00224006DF|nr:ABC transporter permease [Acetivibrio straminisolvens]